MDTGIEILQAAQPSLVIPIPGSYEELVTQIRATPTGLLTYREFGHFLKTTQRGYGEPIRTVLMDLFDWPANRAYARNLKKAKTIIEPPICLSMLSSIATDLLFSYTDTEEWTGGFFGRMLLLYGERDVFRMPTTWPQAHDWLAGLVYQFAQYPTPQCGGFSPPAWQMFEQWARKRDSEAHHVPDRLQTHMAGTATLAAKIALLYAMDAGEPMAGTGWQVSQESMYRAIVFVDTLYLESVMLLGNKLTIGFWEKDRQRVLDVIVSAGQLGITHADLLRRVKFANNHLVEVIDTLRMEHSIETAPNSKGVMVIRVKAAGSGGGGGGGGGGTVIPLHQAGATP